jgi:hypothetical protein
LRVEEFGTSTYILCVEEFETYILTEEFGKMEILATIQSNTTQSGAYLVRLGQKPAHGLAPTRRIHLDRRGPGWIQWLVRFLEQREWFVSATGNAKKKKKNEKTASISTGFFKHPKQYKMTGVLHPFTSKIGPI